MKLSNNDIQQEFHSAIINNDDKKLKLILDNNDVNIEQSLLKVTPLVYSIIHNNDKISYLLLKAGANPNNTSKNGTSALRWASFRNNNKLVKAILENNANPNTQNKLSGETALHIAAMQQKYDSMPIIRSLLTHGAKVSITKTNGRTAYECAKEFNKHNETMLKTLKDAEKQEKQQLSNFRKYCKTRHPSIK